MTDGQADREPTLAEQIDALRGRALTDVAEAARRVGDAKAKLDIAKADLRDATVAAAVVVTDYEALGEAAGVSASTVASWAPKTGRKRKRGEASKGGTTGGSTASRARTAATVPSPEPSAQAALDAEDEEESLRETRRGR